MQHVEQHRVPDQGLGAQIAPEFRILGQYLLQDVEARSDANLEVRRQREELLDVLCVDLGANRGHIRRISLGLPEAMDHGIGL